MKVPAERPPKKAGCREYKEREAVRLEPREVAGGGGTPLYKPYRYVPPQRVWFWRRYGLKAVTVYQGTTVVCECVRRFNYI